ncbi:jg27553 [Pararge aegeria aegeria]|uniref:Jg27553 protein n=1 Tax=Pararge aegeria aegeria TaxID=348720 RepID=A0A8S4SJE5_9NEOP|nr:jg27553 [Pararge aegeria aegeria]
MKVGRAFQILAVRIRKEDAKRFVHVHGILKAVVLLPKKKDIENLIKGLAMIWKTDNLNHLQVKQKNRRLKQLNFGQSGPTDARRREKTSRLFTLPATTRFASFVSERRVFSNKVAQRYAFSDARSIFSLQCGIESRRMNSNNVWMALENACTLA